MFIQNKNSIIINNPYDFNIQHILECGQIFRYHKIDDCCYRVFSMDKVCDITIDNDRTIISCDDTDYFVNFFDLNNDYSAIKKQLINKPFMEQAITNCYGIRILNQNPWEMLISFIISANNHIPRIKSIINKLCNTLGQEKNKYYAFPTPQAMASQTEQFYKDIGAGYRASYLLDTARTVADGFDLNWLYDLSTKDAQQQLLTLKGVGPKVADCILLFGYHKQDVFPVDTWIKKVYVDIVGVSAKDSQIRKQLIDIYGDLSGYAQQYLFFNKRNFAE